jgi:hypothetical protein
MFDAFIPDLRPDVLVSFYAVAFGFAVAGMFANGYRLVRSAFPSFRLLEVGSMPARCAAVPLLLVSAPFIIMRNTLRGRRLERRPAEFVMVATVISGLWSLMSGTVMVMAIQAMFSV